MQAGYRLTDGDGVRIDVETDKSARRVRVIVHRDGYDPEADFRGRQGYADVTLTLTLSEARAISSALMGAAAEA